MTSEEAALYVSERHGCHIDPRDCIYRRGWIFVRDRDYPDIECIKVDPADVWAEAERTLPYTLEQWDALRDMNKHNWVITALNWALDKHK